MLLMTESMPVPLSWPDVAAEAARRCELFDRTAPRWAARSFVYTMPLDVDGTPTGVTRTETLCFGSAPLGPDAYTVTFPDCPDDIVGPYGGTPADA